MDITVIICCFNSASRIGPTLEHISKQELDDLSCELLIIDNNCDDNTVELAIKVWKENDAPFPLAVVRESNPGLSNARKAGVLAARGEIIVFCDDDNWLNVNYLKVAFELFRNDKKIFGACGFCQPVAEIPLPDWFDEYAPFYACGLPLIENNQLLVLRGAGMIVKAKILKALYMKGINHFSSDRKGEELSSGGDDEISFWLKSIGGKVVYSEMLKLRHFMEERRLTIEYRERLVMGMKKSTFSLYHNLKILRKVNCARRKRDFINVFFPDTEGHIARLKLGFFGKRNIYIENIRILNQIKTDFDV